MRFYTKPHQHYCGIDLYSKTMNQCTVGQDPNHHPH